MATNEHMPKPYHVFECYMETQSSALQRYILEVYPGEARVRGTKRGNLKQQMDITTQHVKLFTNQKRYDVTQDADTSANSPA